MAITGTEKVIYGVGDIEECTRFYEDFGLPLVSSKETESVFALDEGSVVVLRGHTDPSLPDTDLTKNTVREVIWGVDTQEELDRLESDLSHDRDVRKDEDGVLHFRTDCGIAMGLSLWSPQPIVNSPDAINSPGNISRFNNQRKWRRRARPTCIMHVVYLVDDPDLSWAFFRDRLNFKLSDISRGFGYFGRCDGRREHHNLFLAKTGIVPGQENPDFDHVNFGVEDIDEMMIGGNHLKRQGWDKGARLGGFGRHRIASALFYYVDCPAGGKAEYGADTDYLDDSWEPRIWNALFGGFIWSADIPPHMQKEPPWEMRFINDGDTYLSDV